MTTAFIGPSAYVTWVLLGAFDNFCLVSKPHVWLQVTQGKAVCDREENQQMCNLVAKSQKLQSDINKLIK